MTVIQLESGKMEKNPIKNHFMGYSQIDVLVAGTSASDAPLHVTYRTIWEHPEDIGTIFGDVILPRGLSFIIASIQVIKNVSVLTERNVFAICFFFIKRKYRILIE